MLTRANAHFDVDLIYYSKEFILASLMSKDNMIKQFVL